CPRLLFLFRRVLFCRCDIFGKGGLRILLQRPLPAFAESLVEIFFLSLLFVFLHLLFVFLFLKALCVVLLLLFLPNLLLFFQFRFAFLFVLLFWRLLSRLWPFLGLSSTELFLLLIFCFFLHFLLLLLSVFLFQIRGIL